MRVYEAKIQYSLVSLGEEIQLNSPQKVADYLESLYADYPVQEVFCVVLLDRKNHPLCRLVISTGTVSGTLVHPREVFRAAVLATASSVIVSHNHPSGDPAPSSADIQITRQLREAGRVLDIPLLDHVIVADRNVYSFRENGLV